MPYVPQRLGKFFWAPYAIILIAVAAALGVGYWIWQAREFSQAFRLLKAGQYEEVIPRTERLIAYGPDKRRAQVIQVRALIELDLEGAREELDALLAGGGVREHPEVGLAYLRLRMESDDLEGIDDYLERWEASLADQPEFHLYRARIYQKQKRWDQVMHSLEQLLAIDPNNAEGLLMRGRLLLSQDNRAAAIQAKAFLREAAAERSKIGLRALHELASNPLIPLFDNDREWLMIALRKHRNALPLSRLLADNQQIILEPDNRDAIIADAIAREGMDTPELLAQWLMSQGAYEQLLRYLNSPASGQLSEEQRWRAQLRVHLQNKDTNSANAMLKQEDRPVSDVQHATLMAFVNSSIVEQGSEPTAEWRQAFELAKEEGAANELLSLGQLAMSKRWMDEADACLDLVIEESDDADLQLRAYNLAILRQIIAGQTAEALALTRQATALKPDNDPMRNNQYYLEGLLNDPADADPDRIAELVGRHPNSVFHSTYAFLLWKAGRTKEAQQQLQQMDRKFFSVPSCRLGGALIALDLGQYQQAARFLQGLQPASLMPEEKELYAEAQAQLTQKQSDM